MEVKFNRTPYTVTYYDQKGEKQTIRRVPPPKLHDALPTDRVELTTQRSDDFQKGESYEVKHINPRHPNTLQLVNEDGQTTFVDFYSARLDKKIAPRDGVDPRDEAISNQYILWP